MGKMTNAHSHQESNWQRRMGVEPTRDRAERPPSRFEDGETHRGPYTSILCASIFPFTFTLVKLVMWFVVRVYEVNVGQY